MVQPVKDYYEILAIEPGAAAAMIQQALDTYSANQESRLNNSLTMKAARAALDDVPEIKKNLLAGEEARADYDQRLADFKRSQIERDEPKDDEGLDDVLPHPFFFDPYDGYDTEMPGYTLRQIGMKLDSEWTTTYSWIKNTSQDVHVLIGYLTFAAGRQQLATRIEKIIETVSEVDAPEMDTNEGIERCIMLLDPQLQRPSVGLQGPYFDGRAYTTHLGDVAPDKPAQTELILYHEGMRGCAFGVVESRTEWITFPADVPGIRFALMPEGTASEIGPSEKKIPLILHVEKLARDADYSAEIVVRVENFATPIEYPVHLQVHVSARSPRVVFDPVVGPGVPLWLGVARRGEAVTRQIRVKNEGDEEKIPLLARIATKDPAVSVRPERFRANDLLTVSIDTRSRLTGERYDITLLVDYSPTPGASGPATLPLYGIIYPTVSQSIFRLRSFGGRVGTGIIGGIVFAGLFDAGEAYQTTRGAGWWALLFLLPLLCLWFMHSIVATIVKHRHHAGNTTIRTNKVSAGIRLGLPLSYALALIVVCALVSSFEMGLWVSGVAGFIVGCALCFIWDGVKDNALESTTE